MQNFRTKGLLAALIAVVFSVSTSMAQAPQAIPYQAVIRNAAGAIVPNKAIGLRFSVRDQSANGTIVYQEEQKATTNALGLFVVNVGQGTLVFGYQSMTVINWQIGSKFLQVEVDTLGGTTYVNIGTQQLLSVPYSISSGDGVPVGTVVAFMGSTPPAGWVKCDGDTLNRVTYKNLFNVIGITNGNGNGITTFNVPDMRGLFLRGWDNGAGNDPDANSRAANNHGGTASGNTVGSTQADAFQGHWHEVVNDDGYWAYALTNTQSGGSTRLDRSNANAANSFKARTIVSDGSNGAPRITSESRPKNVYVNYIIKY